MGSLAIPSIHSPNFNVASPLSSPTPSWAILQTGIAYFFGLILSGGTITGPDYIINPSGIFIYSGAPALGNLIISVTGASGIDGFTNPYNAGFNVYPGNTSIHGGNASLDLDPGSGQVNLVLAPGSNPASAHVNTSPTIQTSLLFPGVGVERQQMFIQTGTEVGADPASITMGGESFDLTVKSLIQLFSDQLVIFNSALSAGFQCTLNNASFNNIPASFAASVTNPGDPALEFMELVLSSGQESSHPRAFITMNSASVDNATTMPSVTIGVALSTAIQVTRVSPSMPVTVAILTPLTATSGSITHPTLITTDTWHPIILDAGWTGGTPVPQYRMGEDGRVQFTGGATHAAFAVGTNVNSSNPLPAAYRPPAGHNPQWRSDDNFLSGLQLLSTGVILALPQAAGNTAADFEGTVALV
jgi:hypothetical protein